MDKKSKKLPILCNGESLAERIIKKSAGVPKEYPKEYDKAKDLLLSNIQEIGESIDKDYKNEYILDEFIVCIRMAKGFRAKSFEPKVVEKDNAMKFVGARNYKINNIKEVGKINPEQSSEEESNKDETSKLYFMRTTKLGLKKFEENLITDKFENVKTSSNQLRSIEKIDLLLAKEKVLGFEDGWNTGRVEIVIHPFKQSKEKAISIIKGIVSRTSGGEISIREYEEGPIFISAKINIEALEQISKYNFLRTVHPLRSIEFPNMRAVENLQRLPKFVDTDIKSSIKIGVFDGGVQEGNPLLENFVNIHNDIINTPIDPRGIEHGSAVSGAVIYGSLNKYDGDCIVDMPVVSVESFRVLPTKNPYDSDLYEVIDIIEQIVPNRTDIDIYNISLGPRGPILDDQISRFTYSLDKLSFDHDVLFCVAVGNDGNEISPLNRIQSPSDIVNGLGVGAHTYNDKGEKVHANYSCIGEGREGCKVKPDIVAFGGGQSMTFHGVSTDKVNKYITAGTSFSSPVVAGMAGRIMAYSKDITPQMARTLLIHTAKNPYEHAENRLGYGCILESENEILNCNDKEVTILYSGKINPAQNLKLPIPLPDFMEYKGTMNITWTISTLVDPNILDSDGYTSYCISETFYPSSEKYSMYKSGTGSKSVNISTDIDKISQLEKNGYKLSSMPKSESGNSYRNEDDRRLDLQWDTIVKRSKNKRITSLKDPFLTIHGMSRSSLFDESIKFSIAITVSMPTYPKNLYDDIINKYKVLSPIKLRNKNEIMVKIS